MMQTQKRLFFIIPLTLIVALCGVSECSSPQKLDNPPYPRKVAGWKFHEEFGVGIVGEFVLKRGEETDNGKIKVRVTKIIPGDPNAESQTYYHQSRVAFQFVKMPENQVLCEDEFLDKSTMTFQSGKCGAALNEFWLRGVSVYSINTHDGWVHFGLVGSKVE